MSRDTPRLHGQTRRQQGVFQKDRPFGLIKFVLLLVKRCNFLTGHRELREDPEGHHQEELR